MISLLFATALAVAAFDASETLVAVALNGAPGGGSSLAFYDGATGTPLAAVSFPDRTNGLFSAAARRSWHGPTNRSCASIPVPARRRR
jgi:hypothetical protein